MSGLTEDERDQLAWCFLNGNYRDRRKEALLAVEQIIAAHEQTARNEAESERDDWRNQVVGIRGQQRAALAERDDLRARLAKVEALAEEMGAAHDFDQWDDLCIQLRAALRPSP